ncbi:DUF1501 domain-containing protein [Lignipirellula cremea]|uniref:DUF1501 domain-containing protein n=1 Tax=Lignipirellula cremea TaxID=2528010 RepID=A0A518DKW8_9BACT|nr:DUF1501 domain-containing protein [Lignipirellula cremea]QDU92475.1 hypothetical protein Pla8534_02230 [Lignipirellula cremea]
MNANSGCQQYRRYARRDFLRIGGAGLFGMSLVDLIRAAEPRGAESTPRAKQMILVWLNGGPPHQDMFDMKPDTPPPFGSELKPIKTNVPGMEFCELMPQLARIADKFSILRSVGIGAEKWEHSGGLYWLTGNPRTNDSGVKNPMYGNVIAKVKPAPRGLPTYVSFGPYKDSGDLQTHYLGPAYDPLQFAPGDPKDQIARMLTPPAELSIQQLDDRESLLRSLDGQLRTLDRSQPLIEGLDKFQRGAFDLLRSPALRKVLDPQQLDPRDVERYGKSKDGSMMLAARQLVEAGVPFVYVPFSPGWDFHGSVTKSCEKKLPALDAALASLLQDLDDRGLLDTTIVTVLGEMGRGPIWKDPAYSGPPGRNHWSTTQFVLVAGGGFQSGMVLGKTDARAQYVTHDWYSPVSYGRTLYHLLGIDPDRELYTTEGRPVKIIMEDAPLIYEALA